MEADCSKVSCIFLLFWLVQPSTEVLFSKPSKGSQAVLLAKGAIQLKSCSKQKHQNKCSLQN